MGWSNVVVLDLIPEVGTFNKVASSLEELLCSPALAAARATLIRLESCHRKETAEYLEKLLLEEDALNQIIDQIRLSEVLDWREAEYSANSAAARLGIESSILPRDASRVNFTSLQGHYRQEAERCDGTQQLLTSLADRAEILLGAARHWRTLAARGTDPSLLSTHLRAAHDGLEATATLVLQCYLGEMQLTQPFAEHRADKEDRSLILPDPQQF